MSVTSVEEFLINTCVDAEALRAAEGDLAGALARAGVPDAIAPLITSGRGPAISAAVRATRPQPAAAEIEAYAQERAAVDPIFAMRLRDEPRPTLERAFLVRFPSTRTVESWDLDGRVVVHVHDRAGKSELAALESSADPDIDFDGPGNIDVDVDVVEIDIDQVIDVETVDIDTDIDTDIVESAAPAGARWTTYWDDRRAHWLSLGA
jgi:hypothetical protein